MSAQTIDVTELVETMQSSFVVWASSYVYGAALTTPGFGWLGLPLVSLIFKNFLNWAFEIVAKSSMMGVFFFGTATRKATEAGEYVAAVRLRKSLLDSEVASDADYEKAERAEIDSFNRLVCLTE